MKVYITKSTKSFDKAFIKIYLFILSVIFSIFNYIDVSGQSLVISDFSGTNPSLESSRPFTNTSYVNSDVVFEGWQFATERAGWGGLSYTTNSGNIDNKFSMQFEHGGTASTFSTIYSENRFIEATIKPKINKALNLSGAEISFTVDRNGNGNSAKSIKVFTNISGFESGNEVFTSEDIVNDVETLTFNLPSSGYDNIVSAFKVRIYFYNARYYTSSSISNFTLTGLVEDIDQSKTMFVSDFSGTDPSLNLPWKKTSFVNQNISFSGIYLGQYPNNDDRLQERALNNAFGINYNGPGDGQAKLSYALEKNTYVAFKIKPIAKRKINLQGSIVSFGVRSYDGNTAQVYSIFTSKTGFSSASNGLYTTPGINFEGQNVYHSYKFTGSEFDNITDSIEVRIYLFDGRYNFKPTSFISVALEGGITVIPDTEAPSPPTGLVANNINQNSFNLTWNASTDDTEVAGYQVFKDGNALASTTGTNYSFTGLALDTEYTVGVKAFDPAGNVTTLTSIIVSTEGKYSQQIENFVNIANQSYGNLSPITISGVTGGGSGNPIIFNISTSPLTGVASITENVITPISVGSITVTASQMGNSQYLDAENVKVVFEITKGNQVIAGLSSIANQVANNLTPITLSGITGGNSGNPVNLNISTNPISGVAILSNNIITPLAVGSITVTASQVGNENYNSANSVSVSFTIAKANQTISNFPIISTQTVAGNNVLLQANSSSELEIQYQIETSPLTGVASISGNNEIVLLGAGVVSVTASQVGNAVYNPANSITRVFNIVNNVIPISSIEINSNLNVITVNGGSLMLSVTILPSNATNTDIEWMVSNQNIATINGTGLLTALSNGVVTVTATSVDNNVFGSLIVEISGQDSVTAYSDKISSQISVYPNPSNDYINLKSDNIKIKEISILNNFGIEIFNTTQKENIDISNLSQGMYYVKVYTAEYGQIVNKLLVR